MRNDHQKAFRRLVRESCGNRRLAAAGGFQRVEEDIIFCRVEWAAGFCPRQELQLFIRVRKFELARVVAAIGDRGFGGLRVEVLRPAKAQLLFQTLDGGDQVFAVCGVGILRCIGGRNRARKQRTKRKRY